MRSPEFGYFEVFYEIQYPSLTQMLHYNFMGYWLPVRISRCYNRIGKVR